MSWFIPGLFEALLTILVHLGCNGFPASEAVRFYLALLKGQRAPVFISGGEKVCKQAWQNLGRVNKLAVNSTMVGQEQELRSGRRAQVGEGHGRGCVTHRRGFTTRALEGDI